MIFIRNATRNVLKLKLTTLYVGISINSGMYVLGHVDVYLIDVYNDIVLRLINMFADAIKSDCIKYISKVLCLNNMLTSVIRILKLIKAIKHKFAKTDFKIFMFPVYFSRFPFRCRNRSISDMLKQNHDRYFPDSFGRQAMVRYGKHCKWKNNPFVLHNLYITFLIYGASTQRLSKLTTEMI